MRLWWIIALLLTPAAAAAQGASRPAVYLDCRAWCDFDHIRAEIGFVDWVRDRAVANVHVLVTSESAGAGGEAFTIAFIPREPAARGDTLRFTTTPTSTDDERRRLLSSYMAAGLVPFVARRGALADVRITAVGTDRSASQGAPRAARDPWDFWVFQLGVDGGISGEARYKSKHLNGRAEANRVTEQWKVNLDFDYEYRDDRVIDDDVDSLGTVISSRTFTNLQRNWEGEALVVRSLGPHLSAGAQGNIEANIFRNIRRAIRLGPAIEYNYFPYSEATRRELVLRYGIGYEVNRYVDTTIFDRTAESLPVQSILLYFNSQQPWGSAEARAEHRNYLRDASKRNSEVGGYLSVRVFQGLNVEAYGEYSWIRDQIALRRGGGNQADVLLRRRELLTGYQFEAGIGLSYTFGSIYSNVVNPRF